MAERFQTLHPDSSKKGVNIDKTKYEAIITAILEALKSRGNLTLKELMNIVDQKLTGSFDGSIGRYYTTVKLDLEARGIIERVPNSKPQRLRLV